MDIYDVIRFLIQIGFFGFVVWYVKVKIKHVDARSLEKLKNELLIESKEYQKYNDIELERFKADLNGLNLKLSALHTERLNVIKELYQHLTRVNSAMYQLTMPMKPIYDDFEKEENERIDRAHDTFKTFNDHFLLNKIYFSPELSDKLEKVRKLYFDANWNHLSPTRLKNMGLSKQDALKRGYEEVKKATDVVRNEIPELLEEIEKEFRTILGVI